LASAAEALDVVDVADVADGEPLASSRTPVSSSFFPT
jgi:hypothetical protein